MNYLHLVNLHHLVHSVLIFCLKEVAYLAHLVVGSFFTQLLLSHTYQKLELKNIKTYNNLLSDGSYLWFKVSNRITQIKRIRPSLINRKFTFASACLFLPIKTIKLIDSIRFLYNFRLINYINTHFHPIIKHFRKHFFHIFIWHT